MALIDCKHCDAEISKNAKYCPKCGNTNTKKLLQCTACGHKIAKEDAFRQVSYIHEGNTKYTEVVNPCPDCGEQRPVSHIGANFGKYSIFLILFVIAFIILLAKK